MRYARADRSLLVKRIRSAKQVLLLLDFDGTLTAIAKKPHEVVLEKRTRQVLAALSRSSRYRLAVVSGRSLKDLIPFIDLKEVVYVGNHGLELKGKGLALPLQAKKAQKLEALVWLLGEKLRKDLAKVPGVWLEDKNYTLSLHYRNIAREYYPFFKQEIARFRKRYAHWPLVWRKGKKVWEVRPEVKWNKGNAASYLAGKMPGALPVVIGDDDTDEDMFTALRRRAVTIRVGRSKRSAAEYYLRSSRDVSEFLGELCRS